jgi:TonB family protein
MARNWLAFLTLFLAAYAPSALAQAPAPAQSASAPPVAVPMPSDPTELMKLAAQVNGLNSPDMKPWHLKATYQTFDDQGKPKDQGTFEEWWAGPEKYKSTYTGPNFNQTEYTTAKGTFREGSRQNPPVAVLMIRNRLIDPIAFPPKDAQFRKRDNPFPKLRLSCFEGIFPSKTTGMGSPEGISTYYCLESNRPMLRFSSFDSILNSAYQPIAEFAGHYLGSDIQITTGSKLFLTIHLDGANQLLEVNDLDFTPPTSAIPAPLRVTAAIVPGSRIGGQVPHYTEGARSTGAQGVVAIEATITKAGTVGDLQVLGGPLLLQGAALDAVKTWRYKPFLLNGEPVEVTTEIDVAFTIAK